MIEFVESNPKGSRLSYLDPESIEAVDIRINNAKEITQCVITTKSGNTRVLPSGKIDDIEKVIAALKLAVSKHTTKKKVAAKK